MEALQIMVYGKLPKMSKVQWDLLKKTGECSNKILEIAWFANKAGFAKNKC